MKKSKSWYLTIQGWMIEDLHLSGTELLVFALINGFCQGDEESPEEYNCHCSVSTMAHRTGVTERSVQIALRNLEKKKLIASENRSGKCTLYRVTQDAFEAEPEPVKKEHKKTEPKGDTPSSQIKQEYMKVVKKGVELGILPTEQVALNSGLINKRIKDLLDKGITPERARRTFEEMLKDDFCVKELGFELASLCSETIFCRMLRKAIEAYQSETKHIQQQPAWRKVCPKCGGELNTDGLCYNCDMDEIINRIGQNDIERKEAEEVNLIAECTKPNE